jgi:hypothetical protein
MNTNRACASALALLLGLAHGNAAFSATGGNALTIYSTARPGAVPPALPHGGARGLSVPGYAVARHERALTLERGRNTVRFADVAALIDPTTVHFESLTDPKGTGVVEQNFQYDLVNTQKLLEKYLDRAISVDQVRGTGVETFTGTLLSTAGGLTLRREDGTVQILPHNAGVRLPELPGGLITRPTLVWDVAANRGGAHNVRVSYQTRGITWWADYNLTYSEGRDAHPCRLDIGAWVSIINQSGASYENARLKLVAGDVHRATAPGRTADVPAARAAAESRTEAFAQKAFFEYHLYTLGRPTTLPDNSTKQIELFPVARAVPCEKTLLYYGAVPAYGYGPSPNVDRNYGTQTNKKVDVYLHFRNAKPHNMGAPLPSGRIRVSKLDPADNTLEFIGEDVIDHTPQDEAVRVKLGSAFDVVGERRQVNFTVDSHRRTMTEEIEVKLRNHKKEAVTVIVKENLYRWVNWQIAAKTHEFEKQDARTAHFPLRVAASGETVLRYTVHYSW